MDLASCVVSNLSDLSPITGGHLEMMSDAAGYEKRTRTTSEVYHIMRDLHFVFSFLVVVDKLFSWLLSDCGQRGWLG